MSKSVSVVMTTYKRDDVLRNTLESLAWQKPNEIIVVDDDNSDITKKLCSEFKVKYIPRIGRPNLPFSNPAIPINIGLKAAKSEVIILQNAECKHDSDVVKCMSERVTDNLAVFAMVRAVEKDGSFIGWFSAPRWGEKPYFWCGGMLKRHFDELGGMDEDFTGAGYDDYDFAVRMKKVGIKSEFASDIWVTHQYHERPGVSYDAMERIFIKKHGCESYL